MSILVDMAHARSLRADLVVSVLSLTSSRERELEARIISMKAELARATAQLEEVTSERDKLRHAYDQLLEHLELLRRRIFVAKAERVDHRQLELEFQQTKEKLDKLSKELEESNGPSKSGDDVGDRPDRIRPKGGRKKPKGRRNLENSELPLQRIEIRDAELEGKAQFIGWEDSYKYGYQRPGPVRVLIARAKYKIVGDAKATSDDDYTSNATIVTAPKPRSLLSRSLLAPSMLAHIIVAKFRFGMPYYRQEESFRADRIMLDRGTMARNVEDAGASLGPIVMACAEESRRNAFCLSTDATGISVRPEPLADGRRQACKKGHFFVVLADKKHIFFEYQPKHTSAAVCDMFRGFSGYIQADAHAVYDALFRGDAVESGTDPPREVACWAHARRRFWDAAVSGYAVGRAGLLRIRKLYELDQSWSDLPPSARCDKRQSILVPLLDEFFAWARAEAELLDDTRGLINRALGYATRQESALRRFVDDGRLRMDNTASEREIKPIAIGRKAWLFFGSDDHASAAANLFSLIASCKLHGLDPELYLSEVIHVMPYWPRDRYLELAPAYWAQTRARLDATELAQEVGVITVPAPMGSSAE